MNQVGVKRRQIQAFSYILGLTGLLVMGGLLEDNGIAYIAAAYECFSFVWILVGSCVSDEIAKILRTKNSKYKNIAGLRRRLMGICVLMGILGAVLLAAGGFMMTVRVFYIQNAAALVFAFVPALVLRNINAGILGFFQGEGAELPTSAASVLRVVFTIGFGLLFGGLLKSYGVKVSGLLLQSDFTGMYAALGVAVAFSAAELFILVFLLVIYKGSSHNTKSGTDGAGALVSMMGLIRLLYSGMSGMAFIMLFRELPVLLGLIFYGRSLLNEEEAAGAASAVLYGVYYGKYLALMLIAVLIADIMLIPQSARVYALVKRDDSKYAGFGFRGGMHIAVIWGLYMSVTFSALSTQIAGIFCSANADTAASMLQGGAFFILFAIVSDYFGRLLYLADKKYMIYGGLGIMNIVFVVLVTVFLNAADMGIMSLVFAGMISCAALCIILGLCAARVYGFDIDLVQNIAIPAGCACISGLICLFIGGVATPHLGDAASVLLCAALSFAVYWLLLLLLHNFREQELRVIPGGRIIRALARMLHTI